jgi:hypothetical protein
MRGCNEYNPQDKHLASHAAILPTLRPSPPVHHAIRAVPAMLDKWAAPALQGHMQGQMSGKSQVAELISWINDYKAAITA